MQFNSQQLQQEENKSEASIQKSDINNHGNNISQKVDQYNKSEVNQNDSLRNSLISQQNYSNNLGNQFNLNRDSGVIDGQNLIRQSDVVMGDSSLAMASKQIDQNQIQQESIVQQQFYNPVRMNENNRIQIKFEFIEEFDGNISFKEAAKRIFDKLNVRIDQLEFDFDGNVLDFMEQKNLMDLGLVDQSEIKVNISKANLNSIDFKQLQEQQQEKIELNLNPETQKFEKQLEQKQYMELQNYNWTDSQFNNQYQESNLYQKQIEEQEEKISQIEQSQQQIPQIENPQDRHINQQIQGDNISIQQQELLQLKQQYNGYQQDIENLHKQKEIIDKNKKQLNQQKKGKNNKDESQLNKDLQEIDSYIYSFKKKQNQIRNQIDSIENQEQDYYTNTQLLPEQEEIKLSQYNLDQNQEIQQQNDTNF